MMHPKIIGLPSYPNSKFLLHTLLIQITLLSVLTKVLCYVRLKVYALPDVDATILDFLFKSATMKLSEVLQASKKRLCIPDIFVLPNI